LVITTTTDRMSIPSIGLGRDDRPSRALYAPREVEFLLSISHAQLYRLIGRGVLTAVKIGRSTYIPAASIHAFLATLPAAVVRSK
jgi:excisionase family DNA binding protein